MVDGRRGSGEAPAGGATDHGGGGELEVLLLDGVRGAGGDPKEEQAQAATEKAEEEGVLMGKGSKRRPEDARKVRERWDEVFGRKPGAFEVDQRKPEWIPEPPRQVVGK